jgi:hypothetical protein
MELAFEIDTARYVKNLVGQFRAMRDACWFAIDESADEFIDEMQKRIREGEPSGRAWHFRYSTGYLLSRFGPTKEGSGRPDDPHIASAPGEPPAILSGKLLRSFSKRTIFSHGHTRIIAHIENDAEYAGYLEYGTPWTGWGGPVHPRPFMAPVMFDTRTNHRMILRVRRAMEAAGHAYGAR